MQYATLGRTGLSVSRLCLGSGMFGAELDELTADTIFDLALEGGVNFIDTGNTCGDGRAESYIGKWLRGKRDKVVVATKVGAQSPVASAQGGLSPAHIVQQVEQSLRRLRTDHIDIYLAHYPD